jgi:acyl-CoA thioester hydrolase
MNTTNFNTKDFIWQVRVYYEDTDSGGVVYYANYLKFLERARTEWLRHFGFEQSTLRTEQQKIFVVRQVIINYHKPAVFDDLLEITVKPVKIGKASLTLDQTIVRQATSLCTASVQIACVNSLNFRPQSLPHALLHVLT